MKKAIELKKKPLSKEYEEYICAYFQSMGFYVEREIIHRKEAEILELDIIATHFQKEKIDRKIIEIKSGRWGFKEIFKVKGWMTFLGINEGVFIVQEMGDSFNYFQETALQMSIDLINNSDLSQTKNHLAKYGNQDLNAGIIDTLRFSYRLESIMLHSLKQLKKKFPEKIGYKNLDDYFFQINCSSFFATNPVQRLKLLFKAYTKYKNITSKMAAEESGSKYEDGNNRIPKLQFENLFYKAKNTPLQIAVYVEHLARLTILKTCTEYLLTDSNDTIDSMENAFAKIDFMTLPQNFKEGLRKIMKDSYFHRYPVFWQFFTYVMGGFILNDFRERELEFISKHTLIPREEIPNAIESFNILFPRKNGWMRTLPGSNIESVLFFPIALSGISANYRKVWHLQNKNGDDCSYDNLESYLTGDKTLSDLIKWNNLAYEVLGSEDLG